VPLIDCTAVPNSVLFLGRPGVGKTTVIREMARVLSDELHKRVVIVVSRNLHSHWLLFFLHRPASTV